MEVRLAVGFLPLLLFAWLPAGLIGSESDVTSESLRLDLSLQYLLQTGSNGISGEVNYLKTTQNNGEKQNKSDVVILNSSIWLVITGVNKAHTGTYTCRMENTTNMCKNGCHKQNKDASQPEESDTTEECRFRISMENSTVKWFKPAGPEVWNQANITVLRKNFTDLVIPCMCAASPGNCEHGACITGSNLTATGKQGTVHSCGPGASQFNVTNKDTWTGSSFPLCIFIGLAVGTLFYVPIIGLLLWQRRRNRRGMSVAEGNQLNTAAPVTGTEDLTYAHVKFEKKKTKPTSSDVIYADIKPPPQKQSGGDASAAKAGVGVSPNGEGK